MRNAARPIYWILLGLWSAVCFMPRSDGQQLAHIADLLAHYQAEEPVGCQTGTFADFLYHHYIDLHDSQDPAHESLPLFHTHAPVFFLTTAPVQLTFPKAEPPTCPVSMRMPAVLLTGYSSSCLRPPNCA